MNRILTLTMVLLGCLLIQTASRAEVVCEKERPLKPIKCVCGEIIGPDGGPISGVTVKVVKEGVRIATKETDSHGNFIFDEVKSGNYELSAQLDGFRQF